VLNFVRIARSVFVRHKNCLFNSGTLRLLSDLSRLVWCRSFTKNKTKNMPVLFFLFLVFVLNIINSKLNGFIMTCSSRYLLSVLFTIHSSFVLSKFTNSKHGATFFASKTINMIHIITFHTGLYAFVIIHGF